MSSPIVYGSVCSGIEAATAAWHPLGWKPEWFCEIEAFPSAVLAHHHPEVPNHGDFTQLLSPAHPARHGAHLDVLVGGTPCQSFSHAGGRAGLDDPRGQLMLRYLDLVGVLRPRWIAWENVPGVLSSGGGRDFGALLGGLADLGYGVAYRVLDARFFGVPQRRRRVFVVGHSGGDAERAARVLALDEGVRGHLASRGNSRKEAAAATRGGAAVGGEQVTSFMATMGGTHGSGYSDGTTPGLRAAGSAAPIAVAVTPFDTTQITCPTNGSQPRAGDTGHPLSATAHPPAIVWCPDVSGPLGGASQSGGFRTTDLDNNGAYIVSCLTPWDTQQRRVFDAAAGVFPSLDACANTTGGRRGPPSLLITDGAISGGIAHDTATGETAIPDPAYCLAGRQTGRDSQDTYVIAKADADRGDQDAMALQSVAVLCESAPGYWSESTIAGTLDATSAKHTERAATVFLGGSVVRRLTPSLLITDQRGHDGHGVAPTLRAKATSNDFTPMLLRDTVVRRLTPRECERIQGFSDDHTLIQYKGKPATDGHRYKALGNSMAVPVMRWIGERLEEEDARG